ncbi:MAG TPA: hypothetical protein VIS07_16315 [Candidatus Binatia bacterium]
MTPRQSARGTSAVVTVARRTLGPLVARLGVRVFDLIYGERPIAQVPPEVPTAAALTVRLAHPDDVPAIAARVGDVEGARVARAAERGDVGVVALSDGAIAGYIWGSRTVVELLDLTLCTLPPDGGYVHAAYVMPEHRGKRVLQVIARALHLELAARGCSFTCRLIDRANYASLVATERSGIDYRWAPVVALPSGRAFFLLGRPGALRRGLPLSHDGTRAARV